LSTTVTPTVTLLGLPESLLTLVFPCRINGLQLLFIVGTAHALYIGHDRERPFNVIMAQLVIETTASIIRGRLDMSKDRVASSQCSARDYQRYKIGNKVVDSYMVNRGIIATR
jgi:hypothetical protein